MAGELARLREENARLRGLVEENAGLLTELHATREKLADALAEMEKLRNGSSAIAKGSLPVALCMGQFDPVPLPAQFGGVLCRRCHACKPGKAQYGGKPAGSLLISRDPAFTSFQLGSPVPPVSKARYQILVHHTSSGSPSDSPTDSGATL